MMDIFMDSDKNGKTSEILNFKERMFKGST